MSEETPAPRPKKKKKRPVEGVATSRIASTERAPIVAGGPSAQWTTGHLAAAMIVGLALGGAGGYFGAGGKSSPGATAESAGSARGTAAGANAQQPPAAGAFVPLAKWSPRHGPEHAKVTILEYSDFQ